MGLDEISRGILEKEIDAVIREIPEEVRTFRQLKSLFQIKEEADFVYGLAIGHILYPFILSYFATYGRKPTPAEYDEIRQIIIKRSREIREAIFNTG